MSNVSYAQNFEDIILFRVLKNIKKGFYIDVGAYSPHHDNVTKLFYDKGWHGINIEPNESLYEELKINRTNDINLNVALGDKNGTLTMNFIDNPGLSTINEELAAIYESEGRDVQKKEVVVKTLNTIFNEYVTDNQQVHFLKIDVEGFEKYVLSGNDWMKNRPWIIVVEAVSAVNRIENYSEWESILLDSCYKYAYADGLNRFYIADEQTILLQYFKYPPNVFDDFILSGEQYYRNKNNRIEGELKRANDKLDVLRVELKKYKGDSHRYKEELEVARKRGNDYEGLYISVINSLSWKITKPLRLLKFHIQDKFIKQKNIIYDLLKALLIFIVDTVRARSRLRKPLIYMLKGFPRLNSRMRRVYASRHTRKSTSVKQLENWPVCVDIRIKNSSHLFNTPLEIGQRTIYYYVDHTVTFPSQTGVQRVSRCLATGLTGVGEKVRYVKWHPESQQCVFLDYEERKNLARLNGPEISEGEIVTIQHPAKDDFRNSSWL